MNDKKTGTKSNYIWNLILQVFLIITPLITTPYVARVLGSEGVGKYSFSYSITYYFTLLALLGFNFYAQREVAKCRDEIKKQSCIFWEIMILKAISTIVSTLLYSIIILTNILEDYNILLFILGLNVVAIFFDPTFLFQANEEFKSIAIKNVIIKLISISLIFIFVKNANDLWVYTLINAGSVFASGIIMIPFLRNKIVKVNIKDLNIKRHIIPNLRLFIPTIAISVYVMLDKTMIGLMVPGEQIVIKDGVETIQKISDIENGYYEQAEKIVRLIMTIVTSLTIVMIPKNAIYLEKKDFEGLNNNVYKALRFNLLLGIPMTLGLICTATNMCPWFFGEGYDKVPYLIMVLSPLILAIGLNGVLGIQYMVGTGKDRLFAIIVTGGAVLNFVMNLILLKFLYSFGVAIASVTAETVILVVEAICLRKTFSLKRVVKEGYKYVISGAIMFGVVFPISFLFSSSILNTIILVVIGVVVYFLTLIVLRDSFFLNTTKAMFNKVKSIVKK